MTSYYPWNDQFRQWADQIGVGPGGGYIKDESKGDIKHLAEGFDFRHDMNPFVLFAMREVLLLKDEDDCLELAKDWLEWAPELWEEQAYILSFYQHRLVAPAGNKALTLAAYLISIYHYYQNIWSEISEDESDDA